MVDYTGIENTLKRLDAEYNAQMSDPQMPILFSKLAVIELCGWIEESFDDLLFEYINTHIIDHNCQRIIKKIIDDNYGFQYERHVFKIFSAVIGVNNWENIIDKLSPSDFGNFQTILNSYSTGRNRAAHTHTPIGTTRSFDAPSLVLSNFHKIKNAVSVIENEIKIL